MTTPGRRLRRYIEARWEEMGHPRHGMVVALAKESGVLRNTMTAWFTKSSTPRLDALAQVAKALRVTRAELVAAMDGDELVSVDRARAIVREELAAASGVPSTPGSGVGPTDGSASPQRSVA